MSRPTTRPEERPLQSHKTMAVNPYVNKVEYNSSTLIDLTSDTVVAADVAQGKYFHLATGQRTQGSLADGNLATYGSAIPPIVGQAMVGLSKLGA